MFNLNKITELNKKIDSLVDENNKLNTINKDYIISNETLQGQMQELDKHIKSYRLKERLVDLLLYGSTSNINIIQKDFSGNIELLSDMQEYSKNSFIGYRKSVLSIIEAIKCTKNEKCDDSEKTIKNFNDAEVPNKELFNLLDQLALQR